MSNRLIEQYRKKYEREVRRRVNSQPWNERFLARMRKAGKEYRQRHPLTDQAVLR